MGLFLCAMCIAYSSILYFSCCFKYAKLYCDSFHYSLNYPLIPLTLQILRSLPFLIMQAADDLDFEDVVEEATSRLGYLEEQTSEFTAASGLNAFLAPALGALNLVGVVYLGAQLGSLPPG